MCLQSFDCMAHLAIVGSHTVNGVARFRVTRCGYFIAKFWLFLGSNGDMFWLFLTFFGSFSGGYGQFAALKTYNRDLKTLIAIGGWNEGSRRFSPLVADASRRKTFIRSALRFLR